MQRVKKAVDLTEGPFLKKMIIFAIPIVISGLLQCFYNAADLIVVGQFRGDLAVAAVGSTGSLTNLIVGLFMGLSVGAGVSVAYHVGAREEGEVRKTVGTSVSLCVICGAVIAVFGFFFSGKLLALMDTPSEVLPLATLYLKIIFLGVPAQMLYNYSAAMMRSAGDSRTPLVFLFVSGLLNVVLNVILVALFGMSVDGVAIATIASQYLSAVMCLVYHARTRGVLRLNIRSVRMYREKLGRILHIGVPSGLQSVLFSLSNVIIQSAINGFGDEVVAGTSASASIEGFVWVAMNAMTHVVTTFVGQNVGAKKIKNVKRLIVYSVLIVSAIGIILGVAFLLARYPLVHLYVSTDASVDAAMQRMYLIIGTYFLCGIMDTLCGALRALDRSFTAMVITLCGACGLRIVWIQTVFRLFPYLQTVYLSYPVSWIVTLFTYIPFIVSAIKKLSAEQRSCESEEEQSAIS